MSIACPPSTREAVETYSANQIEGATPAQLVLQTYDFIIACCRRGDWMRAKSGVVELMGALNPDYDDISGPLFRVYEYCLDVIREKKFEEAIKILSELRESWAVVVDRLESGAGNLQQENTSV